MSRIVSTLDAIESPLEAVTAKPATQLPFPSLTPKPCEKTGYTTVLVVYSFLSITIQPRRFKLQGNSRRYWVLRREFLGPEKWTPVATFRIRRKKTGPDRNRPLSSVPDSPRFAPRCL